MRKKNVLFILICVIVSVCGFEIGVYMSRMVHTNQTKAEIMNIIANRGSYTITITDRLAAENVVEQAVQEHNQKANERDKYSVYKVQERVYWVSSINGYDYDLAGLRLNLVDGSAKIGNGDSKRIEISFTYATEEQKRGFQESIIFWLDYVERNADMQLLEEVKGEVTRITVILTPKNFEEGAVPMALPSFYILANFLSCNSSKYLLKYQ